jgi:hypothetical protein
MQESSLHAALKNWYTQDGDRQEVPVDGYLVDVVKGDLLVEIQTGNFTALKPKLPRLLDRHAVLLVHPIATEKWIIRQPLDSTIPPSRRRSPRKGALEDLFFELVRIPHLVSHPNFAIEILITREEEIRINDGKGSWRRKGWSISDRRLLEVVKSVRLTMPEDFLAFLPPDLNRPFTAGQLAKALSRPRYLAYKMIYCLKVMGLIEETGRAGRSRLYQETTNG